MTHLFCVITYKENTVAKRQEIPYAEVRRRILVVDAQAENRDFLKSILEREYDVALASDGAEALNVLNSQHGFSLVLLDLDLPTLSGLDVLSMTQASEGLKHIPIIMMTPDGNAEEECLRLGAMDVISKPYPAPGVIHARVTRMLELCESRDVMQSTNHDPLTGLYSRDYFFWLIRQQDTHHPDAPMDAVLIDINGFHILNERFGTAEGNTIIRHLATCLRRIAINKKCLACRSFADSFIMYCPHIEDLKGFYDEILSGFTKREREVVHVRMGVYPNADKQMEILHRFNQAKVAADAVKNNRNNPIGIYDETMYNKQCYRERLLEDFAAAIEEGQFVVYYQPKYDVRFKDPQLFSAEALVRWQHPTFGQISPADFIPLLEDNGLIFTLDRYVWERTAQQIRDWKDRLGASIPVSVNMSRIDMFEPDVADIFAGLIKKYRLEPSDLLVEITESAYAQDHELIARTANKLREYGFRIEMDDFGAGYSSLSMLSVLPIDALKLDMQLVQGALQRDCDTRLLEIIVDIADYLSIPVVAEGVESVDQLTVLKALGCDYVQGYYFSKPVPPADFDRFMNDFAEKRKADPNYTHAYSDARRSVLSFTKVATALFSDYDSIVYVDLTTEQYVEYRQAENRRKLRRTRAGENFFNEFFKSAKTHFHPDDLPRMQDMMDHKMEILTSMRKQSFSIFYRLIVNKTPIWYCLKAVLSKDHSSMAVGIVSVDRAFKSIFRN